MSEPWWVWLGTGIWLGAILEMQFFPWAWRKARCATGWCGGTIEMDDAGVYFQCSKCGKITR